MRSVRRVATHKHIGFRTGRWICYCCTTDTIDCGLAGRCCIECEIESPKFSCSSFCPNVRIRNVAFGKVVYWHFMTLFRYFFPASEIALAKLPSIMCGIQKLYDAVVKHEHAGQTDYFLFTSIIGNVMCLLLLRWLLYVYWGHWMSDLLLKFFDAHFVDVYAYPKVSCLLCIR